MFQVIQNSFLFTIFGASGDLAKIKIFPSLYALATQHRLPKQYFIVGYARSKKTNEEFRQEFRESIKKYCQKGSKIAFCNEIIEELLSHVFYFSGQYTELGDFERYFEFLENLSKKEGGGPPETHITYFSVPPSTFQPILQNIAFARKSREDDIRVVLEKPFGEDQASAEQLFHFISRFYDEKQIFLLDHYLGKTAVQSILTLRHHNSVLNLLLEGKNIASIQITAHETVGVEDRAGYFDNVGLIKDMFQSHITQLLAMITMSIPIKADEKSFHREKQSILAALDFTPKKHNIFRAQYKGYKDISGAKKDSQTETYFGAKLKIDRESWYGVPIFIRTGKRMKTKLTSLVVEFKKLPFQPEDTEPNLLIFELQPREMIHIKLLNQFGKSSEYHEIGTSESIACRGDDCLPEHSLLILDVLERNKLHFLSFPEILESWRVTDAILKFIEEKEIPLHEYNLGDHSPEGIQGMFQKSHDRWFEA
ncbi:glucose-6-phosphate dehydrogenase (NADP(+)) [Candidatus Peregrinibacteria bacterium]|nr:MAG: glucose-6-phosphate dehydrogenase (NADP(+)) [Candidatus Peregrinibacteria bacterium]